jgi:predicted transcriptional regulator
MAEIDNRGTKRTINFLYENGCISINEMVRSTSHLYKVPTYRITDKGKRLLDLYRGVLSLILV